MCAATRTSFLSHATLDNVIDGFLARFIFTTGTASPRRQAKISEAILRDRLALIAHAARFHQAAQPVGMMDITDDVLDLAWALEERYRAEAETTLRPDAAGPSLKRLADTVLRIAALLAIDRTPVDEPSVTIEADDFHVAAQMGECWKATTIAVLETLGRTKFQAECEAVLGTIKAHPMGIMISPLFRAHRGLKDRDLTEVLRALIKQQLVWADGDEDEKGRTFYPGPEASL
jgi:hypothetical protein